MQGRVSAVMPNYNHARLIPEALASLLAQTHPYDEILVVDDGSADDSVAVVEALAARHARLRLVRHPVNRGAVAAMNTGLAEARGDYVHFAAADDHFGPTLVAQAAAMLDAHPDAALACGEVALVERRSGRLLGHRPPVRPAGRARAFSPAETTALLRRMDNFVVTPAALFRRSAVQQAGGFDPALGPFTDGVLARQLILRHGFCFLPVVLAEWRVDDSGYSRAMSRDADRALAALVPVLRVLRSDPVFPPWYAAVFERRWHFAVARLAAEAEPIDLATVARMLPPEAAPWLARLRRLPARLRRPALLAGLTLQFRPSTLTGLLGTALARRARRPSSRPIR
jgi:glycosyltransferase involved in cell wall biosynthesis